MSRDRTRSPVGVRAIALLIGAALGAVIGAIIAVNLLIFSGIEGGYEASLSDAFDQRPWVAITIVVVLTAAPAVGAVAALRLRRRYHARP